MDWEFLFRWALMGGSIFACGLLVYLTQLRLVEFFKHRYGHDLAHALLETGTAMLIFAIVQSILLPLPRIPITWQGVLYFGGLLLVSIGGIGLAVSWHRGAPNERGKQ